MRTLLIVALFFLMSAGAALAAATELPAGSIKTLQGSATVKRGDQVLPAVAGMPVYPQDTLETAGNSSLGIILHDDTLLSMGPDSTLALREFVFEPKDHRFSSVVGFLKGTFAYLSGAIGKLSPESIRLETPNSTVAVRGTRLLIKVG